MALRHEAVLRKAGSYVMRPKSSAFGFSCRRSRARTAPSCIGMEANAPVRLSVTERELSMSGFPLFASVFEARERYDSRLNKPYEVSKAHAHGIAMGTGIECDQ